MATVHVDLDAKGKVVTALYACPQLADDHPHYAELEEDDPRVVAFFARADTSKQIRELESIVTPRMIREALIGSSNTFLKGPYKGMTSAQVIAAVEEQIVTLRAQSS